MSSQPPSIPTYLEQSHGDRERSREEVDLFFNKENEVFQTLYRVAGRLDEFEIPYVLVGGLALFHHGVQRLTMDVDLLVTAEGLAKAHDKLEGLGYLPPFEGSRHLVDTVSKVRVEFLVAGQFPGDGKPKEIAFPDPSGQAVEIDGIKVLNLPKLIDLKLASGMINPRRLQDIVDVQRLIETLHLSIDFTEQIAPSVREKFRELHQIVTEIPDPYNDETV